MSVFDFPGRVSWLLIAVSGAAAYAALLALGVTIELGRIALTVMLVAFFLAGSFFYLHIRPDRRLAIVTAATAFTLAFAASTGVLTYPAAATGEPTRDAMFMAFEHWIGIDWRALVDALTSSSLANTCLTLAYLSSLPQIPLTILVLGFVDRPERLATYLSLLPVTLLCTIALFALAPAFGPIPSYGIDGELFGRLGFGGKSFLPDFLALRQGRFTSFDLARMEGMVTFPSFHCVLAVLTAWALLPVRFIGVAAIILNVVVVISTVPVGGHYIADVAAGLTIAFVGLAIWTRNALRHPVTRDLVHLTPKDA
ncbi:MAG: phosphatase PAP2 family protein [Hyphomicrobiales bacterium]|nr:phosphatase PAP2 family protein [Hyphomicrobiales bacterium]MBV9976699.1 phosphatase PAP2 family protein [Hyphomicrobiales bacterium]